MRTLLKIIAIFAFLFVLSSTGHAQTVVHTLQVDCHAGCSAAKTVSFSTAGSDSIFVSLGSTVGTITGVSCSGSSTVTLNPFPSALSGTANYTVIYMSQVPAWQVTTATGPNSLVAPPVTSCTINSMSGFTGAGVIYEVSGINQFLATSGHFTACSGGTFPCVQYGSTTTTTSATISGTTESGSSFCLGVMGYPATPTITGTLTSTDYNNTSAGFIFNSANIASSSTVSYTGSWTSTAGLPVATLGCFYNSQVPQVALPIVSPYGGNYHSTQTVTASDLTPGSTIYYSTSGAATCSSTVYSGPLTVSTTTTLSFIACETGYTASPTVNPLQYTIVGGSPQTWYIRPNGGTRLSTNVPSGQCSGLYDVDYSVGVAPNCAFNDFRYMWDDASRMVGQGYWVMAGGDTVIIRGCTALSDQLNPDNPHCRIGWDTTSGSSPNNWCVAGGGAFGCLNPEIPAGTSGQHTRILGQNFASCNTGGLTNPRLYESNLTQIFGGRAVQYTLNLQNTQYVDVECLELTTHNSILPTLDTAYNSATTYALYDVASYSNQNYVSLVGSNTNNRPDISPSFWQQSNNCIRSVGAPSWPHTCNPTPPDDYSPIGIATTNATSNITMQDVYIHGFMSEGLYGPIGGPITMTRMFIGFNTSAGWQFDDGAGTLDAPGSSITATHVIMEGNGCEEEYPIVHSFPALVCYDGSSAGFGDSWSGQNTTMDSMTCNDCQNLYNTKDGFIGPHTGISTLLIENSVEVGNMGQSWKWGGYQGPNNTTFVNNLTVGNCYRMSTALPGAAANYNQFLSAFCRAGNETMGSAISPGSTWTMNNNSWVTYMNTAWFIACSATALCPSTVISTNNIFLGYTPTSGPIAGQTPAIYAIGNANITLTASHNIEYGMRNGSCPSGGTGMICLDPLFIGEPAQGSYPPETVLDSFDFYLTGSSPALSAGTTPCPLAFADGTSQTSPCTIGALGTGTPVAAIPATSLPAGTYVGAQITVLSTSTSGGVICWTVSPAVPAGTSGTCTSGTTITGGSGSVSIPSTMTIEALTTASGYTNSSIATYAYGIILTPYTSQSLGTSKSLGTAKKE